MQYRISSFYIDLKVVVINLYQIWIHLQFHFHYSEFTHQYLYVCIISIYIIISTRISNLHECSQTTLTFLDVSVQIAQKKILITLHKKPTDCHCYLRYTSCHPVHIKDSIIYSQFLRYKRIYTRNRLHWTQQKINLASAPQSLTYQSYHKTIVYSDQNSTNRTFKAKATNIKEQSASPTNIPSDHCPN